MRNYTYVKVGAVVVGAFTDKFTRAKCLRQLAPGCKAEVKKGHRPLEPVPQMLPKGKEQQQIVRRSSNVKFRYLKPGEFTL